MIYCCSFYYCTYIELLDLQAFFYIRIVNEGIFYNCLSQLIAEGKNIILNVVTSEGWLHETPTCTIYCVLQLYSWFFLEYFKFRKLIFKRIKKNMEYVYTFKINVTIKRNFSKTSLSRKTRKVPNLKNIHISSLQCFN